MPYSDISAANGCWLPLEYIAGMSGTSAACKYYWQTFYADWMRFQIAVKFATMHFLFKMGFTNKTPMIADLVQQRAYESLLEIMKSEGIDDQEVGLVKNAQILRMKKSLDEFDGL